MRCEEALQHALDDDVPRDVRLHIQGCGECTGAVAEARRGRAVLGGGGFVPPPGLEDAVVAAVADAKTGQVSRSAGPRVLGPGAIAVSVFAAIAAAVGLFLGLGGPRVHRISLAPTDAAPAAKGSVTVFEEGDRLRVVLEVAGLPRSGPDAMYEMWVRTDDKRLSAGTFRASDQQAVLRVPVKWSEWRSCGVTLLDGSHGGSGTPVLQLADEGAYIPAGSPP